MTSYIEASTTSEESLSKSGPLWSVLTSSGLWDGVGNCGLISNFKEPVKPTTYMIGTPFATDSSTSENKNLRLLSFTGDSLDGPVRIIGPQSIFFNNYLIHTIEWELEKIDSNAKEVSVAFYTSNYTSETLDTTRMLPMISTKGPTFYERVSLRCKKKYSFTSSTFVDMYVVVDANILIKLWVSYKVPAPFFILCPSKLYEIEKYSVLCLGNLEIVATQQLVAQSTLTIMIRPVNKYIELSRRMIIYLLRRSVIISLFVEDTLFQTPLSLNLRAAPYFPQLIGIVQFLQLEETPGTYFLFIPSINIRTTKSFNGRGIVIQKKTSGKIRINFTLKIQFNTVINSSILDFLVEVGGITNNGFQNITSTTQTVSNISTSVPIQEVDIRLTGTSAPGSITIRITESNSTNLNIHLATLDTTNFIISFN